MVNKLWRLVVVGVVASLLASTSATAAEKQTKEDRDRKAKAALAIAATKDTRPAVTIQVEQTVRISLQVACEVIRAIVQHISIDDDQLQPISFRRAKAQAALAACTGPNCPAPGPQATPGATPAVVPMVEVTGGTCANGSCAVPAQSQGWYPGKFFRRR